MDKDKISKCCRLCMTKHGARNPIFNNPKVENMTERIMLCTGIKVTPSDKKPKQVCKACLTDLLISYDFISTCIQTDEALNDLLEDTEEKDTIIVIDSDTPKEEPLESDDDYFGDNDVCEKEIKEEKADNIKYEIKIEECNKDEREAKVEPNTETIEKSVKRKRRKVMDESRESEAKSEPETKAIPVKRKRGKYKKKDPSKKKKASSSRGGRTCNKCNLKFNSHTEFMKHYNEYHKAFWMCEICGKVVLQCSAKLHMSAHFPPTLQCPHCPYKAHLKCSLKLHLLTHSDEKRYVCTTCGGKFRTSSSRAAHVRRTHLHEKRFSCQICAKRFYDKQKLQRHMDVHFGTKRYTCEICRNSFSRSEQHRHHVRTVHQIALPKKKSSRKVLQMVGMIPDNDKLPGNCRDEEQAIDDTEK